MGQRLPKVLIVEDDNDYQGMYSSELGEKVHLLQAFTINEAEEMFAENSDIALVVMDACVASEWPNTQELVRLIRASFKVPMIAASSDWDYRQELKRCGCDHDARKDKVPAMVVELLGL